MNFSQKHPLGLKVFLYTGEKEIFTCFKKCWGMISNTLLLSHAQQIFCMAMIILRLYMSGRDNTSKTHKNCTQRRRGAEVFFWLHAKTRRRKGFVLVSRKDAKGFLGCTQRRRGAKGFLGCTQRREGAKGFFRFHAKTRRRKGFFRFHAKTRRRKGFF
jgi:hypothetical protein